MKILIAGGTGFLGTNIIKYWPAQAEFNILSTNIDQVDNNLIHYWDGHNQGPWVNLLKEADVVINLAGKSVNCRYTKRNKQEILQSRIRTTRAIGDAISNMESPPPLWLNASTATIYRDEWHRPNTEIDGILGDTFSEKVAKQWEQNFFDFHSSQIRQVALRTSLVFGADGELYNIFRKHIHMGLSGRHGSGNQKMSWIHVEDFVRAIYYIIEHQEIEGSVNLTSPNPITDREFLKTLCDQFHKRQGLPMPEWMLNIGAIICKSETELLLKSRWVLPKLLLDHGFEFKYPILQNALQNIESQYKQHDSLKFCPLHC